MASGEMTFGEYTNYQAPPGFRDQLIHGKVVLSPSPNRQHQDVCDTLHELLKALVRAQFVVRMDTTHMLGLTEGPRPDVFVIRKDRWVAADETGGYPEGSPELVVEVLSPSNSAKQMEEKRRIYFADPRCLEVWEVSLDSQSVTRHRRDAIDRFESQASVTLPASLGNGAVPVAAIFAGIVR